ncbi:hypothetical protein SLS54_009936 [Diplodia seriata]
MAPWTVRPGYKTYQSRFGPNGTTLAGFGAAAGVFAIFMFAEVPRVREDIMKKVPVLGEYFDVKVAPEDNPF